MSDKLGFTFYPKDWWTSESYFELEPIERYIYLECLFVMYSNDGFMKTQKTQMERRLSVSITEEQWVKITSKFIIEEGMFTHKSVNKRLRKAIANRENGIKGGRPKKEEVTEEEKPKEPNLETQKNPPLEREREREKKENKRFIPPTFLEVKEYCQLKGYTEELATKSFNHYHEGDWKDTNGNQVKNWKQKILTNWFKDEYKIQTQNELFTAQRKMVY